MIKLKDVIGYPSLQYHLDNNIPLLEHVYRYSSDSFMKLFQEARKAGRNGEIGLSAMEREILETTDIGEYGIFEGEKVPLDLPMVDDSVDEAEYQGKDVDLNKPKRGGSKKFYVYTKNPKTGKVIKVAFGAKDGGGNLAVKLKDPKARKAFATRHDCANKKDKTKPSYWSCRLPRYAKQLGMKAIYSGWW